MYRHIAQRENLRLLNFERNLMKINIQTNDTLH